MLQPTPEISKEVLIVDLVLLAQLLEVVVI